MSKRITSAPSCANVIPQVGGRHKGRALDDAQAGKNAGHRGFLFAAIVMHGLDPCISTRSLLAWAKGTRDKPEYDGCVELAVITKLPPNDECAPGV